MKSNLVKSNETGESSRTRDKFTAGPISLSLYSYCVYRPIYTAESNRAKSKGKEKNNNKLTDERRKRKLFEPKIHDILSSKTNKAGK